MPRKIQIQKYSAPTRRSQASLLFAHGAYVNSSCWEFNFIPFFQAGGYDCVTIDFSGHGGSEGRERIDTFGIEDYVEDLAAARREIDGPAIIIGHSMGARVLERYLEHGDAQAAIFLSPVPSTGTSGSAIKLALRHPEFFGALDEAVSGNVSVKTGEMMTKIYFSPAVSAAEAMRFLPMLGPESQRAVLEMAVPDTRLRIRRRPIPSLVAGGTEDAVFPSSMLHFMAASWQAELYRATGAGHMLMLDPQWPLVAQHMLDWIEKKLPA